METLLLYLIDLCVGLAAALFGYLVIKAFFLTRYESYNNAVFDSFDARFGNLGVVISPQKLMQLTMAVTSILFFFGMLLAGGHLFTGLFLGAIFCIPGLLLPRLLLSIMLARRLTRIGQQLPVGLELLANSLRAGMTLAVALERNLHRMPEELRQEFGGILREFKIGASLSDAITHWSERVGLGEAKLIASATRLSLERGGSLAEIYFTLSSLIRQRNEFNGEVKAMTAEGRFQALLMTILPFVLLLLMTCINYSMMMEFFVNPWGKALLTLMVLMQIAAYFWIRKLITFDL